MNRRAILRPRLAEVTRVVVGGLCGTWLVAACLAPAALRGQAPGVVVEENEPPLDDARMLAEAEKLRTAGKLLSQGEVRRLLRKPTPAALKLPAPSQTPLAPAKIAARARGSMVRVGWYYLCEDCDDWHLDLAGGYAIANGAAATCRHCIDPDEAPMREGWLVAQDVDGALKAVTAVLAADEEMDAAVVRVEGMTAPPAALCDVTAPGDATFVYSDPMSVAGHFAVGHVNRFFWADPDRKKDLQTLAGVRNLRLHVSNDWAPGSSGSAVYDVCGNVVGHVAAIEHLMDEPSPDDSDPAAEGDVLPKDKPHEHEKGRERDPGGDKDKDKKKHAESAAEAEKGAAPAEKERGEGEAEGLGKAERKPQPPPLEGAAYMILHEAVPARSVRMLVESMGEAKSVPEKPAAASPAPVAAERPSPAKAVREPAGAPAGER